MKIPAPTSPFQTKLKEKQFVSLVKANTNACKGTMAVSKENEEQKIA